MTHRFKNERRNQPIHYWVVVFLSYPSSLLCIDLPYLSLIQNLYLTLTLCYWRFWFLLILCTWFIFIFVYVMLFYNVFLSHYKDIKPSVKQCIKSPKNPSKTTILIKKSVPRCVYHLLETGQGLCQLGLPGKPVPETGSKSEELLESINQSPSEPLSLCT